MLRRTFARVFGCRRCDTDSRIWQKFAEEEYEDEEEEEREERLCLSVALALLPSGRGPAR